MKNDNINETILRLIRETAIADQEELRQHLLSMGYDVSQSTLSRRLKKLNVHKGQGRYVKHEKDLETPKFNVRVVPCPPNIIMLKTNPGFAQGVAFHLDTLDIKSMAGCVAGDDSIAVVIKSPEHLKEAINDISWYFKAELNDD